MTNKITGILFLLIGITFYSLSNKYTIGSVTEPGPGMYPLVVSLILIILSVLIFFSSNDR